MKKVALITGGSGGIGRAIAKELFNCGYNIAFTYNSDQNSAEQLLAELKSDKVSAIALKCDCSVYDEVSKTVKEVIKQYGKIDILINNAGIAWQGLFTEMTEKQWDNVFNVNIKGVFNFTRLTAPYMISKHSGKIINISSMWGQVGSSCEVAYSASKAAVIGFTKALAKELGPSNIIVNCICPGIIKTHMLDCYDDETLKELADETPLSSLGMPEDIANTVSFLASQKSDFITGQIIGVNGGFII